MVVVVVVVAVVVVMEVMLMRMMFIRTCLVSVASQVRQPAYAYALMIQEH